MSPTLHRQPPLAAPPPATVATPESAALLEDQNVSAVVRPSAFFHTSEVSGCHVQVSSRPGFWMTRLDPVSVT